MGKLFGFASPPPAVPGADDERAREAGLQVQRDLAGRGRTSTVAPKRPGGGGSSSQPGRTTQGNPQTPASFSGRPLLASPFGGR